MSWNEVKIHLAPVGTRVYLSRDRSTNTADGYPVTVVTTLPPSQPDDEPVNISQLKSWLAARNFNEFSKKERSSRYDLDDMSLSIFDEQGRLNQVTLNLKVGLDARSRIEIWEKFAAELCEVFHLQLIDAKAGLVKQSTFQDLVKRSFAWECFLKREIHFTK